jgi:hypothetical protein
MQESVPCDSNGVNNVNVKGNRTDGTTFYKQHEPSLKCDGSDSGPDEASVLRESRGDTFLTCMESHEHRGAAANTRKRRRHHKHNSCKKVNSPATEKRENMNNEGNSLNKLLHVRQRKLTLLEKVGESNVIVRFFYCSYKPSIFMPFVCIHNVDQHCL